MKNLLCALTLTAALLPLPALAADHHDMHAGHGSMAATKAEATLTPGVIKKVDKAAGKLTVAHAPLPNGMPAMTMAFKVKEANWLEQFKEGQAVRFAVDEASGLTIVRLEAGK